MVSIEDYFNSFMNDDGFNRRSSDRVTIEDYNNLIQKYKLLAEEHKRIKTKNDELLKEIDDLKDDSRKLKQLEEDNKEFFNLSTRRFSNLDHQEVSIPQQFFYLFDQCLHCQLC